MVLGSLMRADRSALATVVAATGAFSEAEVTVALELFDEAFATGGGEGVDSEQYAFVGAFASPAERRLLGYACWGRTPDTPSTYDLYWLAVDPPAQGAGVGAALVREVQRRLAAIGGRLLVIEASGRADTAPARRFYERMGGTAAAVVRDFYGPGDDRITYTMPLHGTGFSSGSEHA